MPVSCLICNMLLKGAVKDTPCNFFVKVVSQRIAENRLKMCLGVASCVTVVNVSSRLA